MSDGCGESWAVRTAHRLGWRAYVIPVLVVITAWVVVDVVRGTGEDAPAGEAGHAEHAAPGPTPGGFATQPSAGVLPPGPDFAVEGSGNFLTVGAPGAAAGEGRELHLDYVTQIEDVVDAAVFGGADAFAAMVDATLTDPVRGWTADPKWGFRHVAEDEDPDMLIQLVASDTAAELCGQTLKFEVSCRLNGGESGPDRIILNNSRWIRGASTFEGDLGGYRHYLINHEVGHALGYGHDACPADGALAPVMLQQSLALDNKTVFDMGADPVYPDNGFHCRANGWPYPTGR
ncbi:DUF3152 domain-containing protein [Corynebacterium sp. 335C]